MRVLIVGAGGVGGYLASRLSESGERPVLLLRDATAEQVSREGLSLRSVHGDWSGPVDVVTAKDLARKHEPFDLVVIACKSYDLPGVLDALAPAVGADTAVLPFLNGLAHLSEIAKRFGDARSWGGVAHIGATTDGPGRIVHMNDLHTFRFGPLDGSHDDRAAAFKDALARGGVDGHASGSIRQDMWDKFVFLAALASATCLFRASVGAIVRDPAGNDWIEGVLAECAAVASAEGHPPASQAMDVYRGQLTDPASQSTSSMLRDMMAGRPTEGVQVVGDMLVRANRHALDAPHLALAAAALRIHEDTIASRP